MMRVLSALTRPTRYVPTIAMALMLAAPALAQEEEDYAKLGPNAVSITEDFEWLRSNPAPDFWAFSPFVKPQFTSSACSIATVTAALTGLAGVPAMASETILTQPELLDLTGEAEWATLSAEGGDGVTFAQLETFAGAAATAMDLGATVTAWQPMEENHETLAATRRWLAENEVAATDALMVYYNQGVVTGDWDGPHVALIGAYDAAGDRVLILEVDQSWYVPYWTPVPVLLEAMVKPTSAEHGVLEGEQGGFVRVALPG